MKYTIEEITEALAGATITGDVLHRLTKLKKTDKRYFLVFCTATKNTNTIEALYYKEVNSNEYLNIESFIEKRKIIDNFDFILPTNIIELSESDYNDAIKSI